jgi:hypothetical protein
VPSVQHSVKGFFAESLTLPSAALGKAFFAECPTKGTRQRIRHSAKPRIPVVQVPTLPEKMVDQELHDPCHSPRSAQLGLVRLHGI